MTKSKVNLWDSYAGKGFAAQHAEYAERAAADINGNDIVSTYSAKIELDTKVDKESGKGLSTNDFTDAYKNAVDANTSARHTHSNKSVLDGISSTDVTNWNGKQNALPTSGTPSDTYAVNISGNAATASTASSVSWDNVSGKPTIPSSDSDLTNDRYVRYDTDSQGLGTTEQCNARTNIGAGTYTKPSGGIPNTDLASAVQTSLGKADSSIQSVKSNGTALSPDANKGVDIPPASTSVYGVVTFTEVELDELT